jgi:hypothetical protein
MTLPSLTLVILVFFVMLKQEIFSSINDLGNQESIVKLIVCTVIPVVFTYVAFRIYITKQRYKWLSYELIIDENRIMRKQEGNSTIEISRSEITNIRESIGYGIFVSTNNRRKMIFIPESAEQYDKIRVLLNLWSRIEEYHPKIKGNTLSVFLANRNVDNENYMRRSRNFIISRLLIIVITIIFLLLLVFILVNSNK